MSPKTVNSSAASVQAAPREIDKAARLLLDCPAVNGAEEKAGRRLTQLFTGNGKGKTSAALGVVLRSCGHGFRSHIIYFMKGDFPYGEQAVLGKLPNVTFERFGFQTFVDPNNVKEEEKQQARLALQRGREAVLSGRYDVVVLDEVNVAVAWKMIDIEDVLDLVRTKPDSVELVLTGRYADRRLIEAADLVTEMVETKHPYRKGVLSRKGFDY